MPSRVSSQRLSGASTTSAPQTAWWYPPGTNVSKASSLACPPGAVPAVVAEGDGLGEGHVEADGPGDGRGHLGHLQGMGEAGALVVVGEHEDLGLAGQASERRGVQDAVTVAFEAGAQRIG